MNGRRITISDDLDNPRQLFRLLVLYRWLSLIPALIALFSSTPATPAFGVGRHWLAVGMAILANALITRLSRQLNRLLRTYPWLLALDLLLASALIALSGGWRSPYYLYALSPLLVAAFFFRLRGAVVATSLFLPLYVGASLAAGQADWLMVWVNLVGLYLISGVFGYAAGLLAQLRDTGRDLATAHRDLAVLNDFTAALHNAADVAAVQETVLEALTVDLGFRRVVLGLVDEEGAAISGWLGRVRDGQTAPKQTLSHTARLPLTPEGGLAARALLEGRTVHTGDEPCTAQGWLNTHFGLEKCLIIPLRQGRQPVGILLVDTEGQDTDEARQSALQAMARQAAVTIGMMQTRLRQARESAVQAERARIALEMHDALSQSLFGVVFTLDGSLKLLDSDPQAVRPELERALQTAESARREIRRTIHDMWSEEITPQAFETELRRYAADVLQAHTLRIDFDIRGDFNALSSRARRSLYRIAQECLTNVVQHAAASESRVCVDVEDGRAQLVVRDNGRGFEPDQAVVQEHGREHFGLRGMQDRARSLGGTCDIFSQPGAGTSVVIDVPANTTT